MVEGGRDEEDLAIIADRSVDGTEVLEEKDTLGAVHPLCASGIE
jgi:hypothetical protein